MKKLVLMKYLNKKDMPYYCYIREEDKPEANNNRDELMEEGAEETLCAGRMKEPHHGLNV